VAFGDYLATSFTVVSPTEITAVSPAQPLGVHNIVVTNSYGMSAAVSADEFTYVTPTVTGVSPSSGPALGGTTVTITGTDFTGATEVQFYPAAATSFTVVSSTEIAAVTPARVPGTYYIIVTTPDGTNLASSGGAFTYIGPMVTFVSPSAGPALGGTTVTLTGTAFTGATNVSFGSVPATSFTVVSPTEITAVSPAQTPRGTDIFVTTPDGTSPATIPDEFTYISYPAIADVSPNTGPTAGGTTVTITGVDFGGTTKVVFGTVAALAFTVVSSTVLTAVSPPQAPGPYNVRVTATGGTSPTAPGDDFSYIAAPAVTGVSPSSGPASVGTTVTITGTGFANTAQVLFGAVPATIFTVVSSTEITAVSPAQAPELHNIYVTTLDGTSATVTADQFTYLPPPAVTGVSPSSGPPSGGTTVTITGTAFSGATNVFFGTVPATNFTVVSPTEITAVSPRQAAELHNIYVTTPDGASATVTADQFTYLGTGA
jgi:hypothetical protein